MIKATESDLDLAERLRSRSKFHPLGGVDRKLMIGAAERLENYWDNQDIRLPDTPDWMDAEEVFSWLLQHDVKLLPWQTKRLGIEE